MFSLFGDPQHSFTDQILRAYEYQDKWVNRMILGDSLVVGPWIARVGPFTPKVLRSWRKS
jgi:hypothetical protein